MTQWQATPEAIALFDKRRPSFAKYCQLDDASGCVNWTAQISPDGYGKFKLGRVQLAHRAALLLDGQVIPDGMVVDHICRNRCCVNPQHLRVVSPKTNTLENSQNFAAINAAKTHCLNGHPLVADNLYKASKGGRACKQCIYDRTAKYRKEREEANMRLSWQHTPEAVALLEKAYNQYAASNQAHWEFPCNIEADLAELCDPDADLDVIGAWDAYVAMREANPLAVAA